MTIKLILNICNNYERLLVLPINNNENIPPKWARSIATHDKLIEVTLKEVGAGDTRLILNDQTTKRSY